MDISPTRANLSQLQQHDGQYVEVESDVMNIAADLRDIDPGLKVRWSMAGKYFVIYYQDPDTGKQDLITTALELDQRIVNRIRKVASREYDFAKELERIDKEADEKIDSEMSDQVRERGERLAYALRKDYGIHKTDLSRITKKWGSK